MNAPATAAALAHPTVELLALDSITPSRTHIQAMRRKRFDPKLLQELADSFRQVGVLQPVVVVDAGNGKHELVAGERRWQAARLAGLERIPASVRTLTPEQILEVQLIENLQREGLHELEEAEGYEELMKLKKINADTVAEMIGKSRAYVYARTKLLDLCDEARKGFYAGAIDFSIALLIARVPGANVQRQAMKDLDDARKHGDITNVREAQVFMREHYMLQLAAAPFDTTDTSLVSAAGACSTCPKRSGAQPELFADVGKAEHCTDPGCFAKKRTAHFVRIKESIEAKGGTVITGKEAKKLVPHDGDYVSHSSGYTALDDEQYIDGKYQKIAKLAKAAGVEEILVEHPESGKLIPVVRNDALKKALTAKGHKMGFSSSSGGGRSGPSAAQLAKLRCETEARLRIFNAIREALATRKLDEADTRLVVEHVVGRLGFDTMKRLVDARNLAAGVEKPKGNGYEYVREFEDSVPKMPLAALVPLMIECVLAGDLQVSIHCGNDTELLDTTAKRYKIDAAKIRREAEAEKMPAAKAAKAKGKKK
jgi:ParB/RepB/Spo0J family partition protein